MTTARNSDIRTFSPKHATLPTARETTQNKRGKVAKGAGLRATDEHMMIPQKT